jgi:copper(I)-binding protein
MSTMFPVRLLGALALTLALAISCLLTGTSALAQTVDVQDAWARASVPGQKATGAFMKITASADTRLVSISTTVAAVAEVHEMKVDGGVMTMRAVTGGLALPAGKPVELKPGSYHLMLMDLKQPLQKDTAIPITLVFKDAAGKETRTELKVPVSMSAPAAHNH